MEDLPILTPAQQKDKLSKIRSLVTSGQLTQEGFDYLVLASDPWHDNKVVHFAGIPDTVSAESVTLSLVREVQIKKPASIAAGTNWSCRICNWGVDAYIALAAYARKGNIFAEQSAAPEAFIAPVTIDFQADGVNFGAAASITTGQYLDIPSNFTQGSHRLCAMGIEVVNTTAELNLQGLCSIARIPMAVNNYAATLTDATGTGNMTAQLFGQKTAPINLNDMVAISGTTQWHAKDGAYTVVSLKNTGMWSHDVVPEYPMIILTDLKTGSDVAVYNNSALGPNLDAGVAPYPLFTDTMPGRTLCDQSIIMFTGLSDTSTLTIRARFILERFPGLNESELLPLTKPSAPYDPLALQLYAKLMTRIPPGCKFTENPSGEWWARMVGGLAEVAGPILAMFPHPAAKVAGTAAAAAAVLLKDYADDVQKNKKKKNKKPVPAIKAAPPVIPKRTSSLGQAPPIPKKRAGRR